MVKLGRRGSSIDLPNIESTTAILQQLQPADKASIDLTEYAKVNTNPVIRIRGAGAKALGKLLLKSRYKFNYANGTDFKTPSLRAMAEYISTKTGFHISKDTLHDLETGVYGLNGNYNLYVLMAIVNAEYVKCDQDGRFYNLEELIEIGAGIRNPKTGELNRKSDSLMNNANNPNSKFSSAGMNNLGLLINRTRVRLREPNQRTRKITNSRLSSKIQELTLIKVPVRFLEGLQCSEGGLNRAFREIQSGEINPNKFASYLLAMSSSKLFLNESGDPFDNEQLIKIACGKLDLSGQEIILTEQTNSHG